MSVNAIKNMISKFEEVGSPNVAPGKGRCATATAIVEEVAIATAEATEPSSDATVSGRSINSTGTGHSVGHRTNHFTQNSEALPL